MSEQKIEVGDVFVHASEPNKHCTAMAVDDEGWITDECGEMNSPWNSKLVRKAAKDPYAGLTLPEPPKGYRLAKWGEDIPDGSLWWDVAGGWNGDWNFGKWPWSKWEACIASANIFAVPIESTLPKTWQFCEEPWTAPEAKTLADCPDDTDIIGCYRKRDSVLCVVFRRGQRAYWRQGNQTEMPYDTAADWQFIRYLAPQPSPPLTLEQVPDGRVILIDEREHWRSGTKWFRLHRDGTIREAVPSLDFAVTNLVAAFK